MRPPSPPRLLDIGSVHSAHKAQAHKGWYAMTVKMPTSCSSLKLTRETLFIAHARMRHSQNITYIPALTHPHCLAHKNAHAESGYLGRSRGYRGR